METTVKAAKAAISPLAVAFIVLEKAFDSVSQAAILSYLLLAAIRVST